MPFFLPILPAIFVFLINLVVRVVLKVGNALITRLPVYAAYLALVLAVTAAYLFSAHQLIGALNQTVPQIAIDVWGWFMPSNAAFLLTTWYTAKLIKWAYTKHLKIVHKKTEIIRKI